MGGPRLRTGCPGGDECVCDAADLSEAPAAAAALARKTRRVV